MRLFSQREGFKPVKSVIQVESMDDDLRIGLWNALTKFYWDTFEEELASIITYERPRRFIEKMWQDHLKWPIDTLGRWRSTLRKVREFYFSSKWYDVYDFIEFIASNDPYGTSHSLEFMACCNPILERESSAYRFVGGKITPITSKEEIAEIEQALETPLKPISEHIKSALDLLANRKSPNYRNSIKESISAVEAIFRLITKHPKATLGMALDIIERENKVKMHPALKQAFDKIYGYTSSEGGIRHALLEEPKLDFEDAKFMLVSCSSFVNYLIVKSTKAGIKL